MMLLPKTKVFEKNICTLHWKLFFIPQSVKKNKSSAKINIYKNKSIYKYQNFFDWNNNFDSFHNTH